MRTAVSRLSLRFLTQAIAIHVVSLLVVLFLGGLWLASRIDHPMREELGARHALDEEEVARRISGLESCPPLASADAFRLFEKWSTRAPREPEVESLVARLQALKICSVAEAEAVLSDDEKMSAVNAVYRALVGRPPDVGARLTYGQWLAQGIPVEIVVRDISVSPELQTLRSLGER